jgi:hypothetical protein
MLQAVSAGSEHAIQCEQGGRGQDYALGSARLDPQFQRESDALTTKLSNQGLQPGSAAWNAQMTQFGQNKNDAYNQLYLGGKASLPAVACRA